MEERERFVRDARSDRYTMTELCARYGVSRRIGYVWLARYETDGRRGLVDRSHAPHHCPQKIRPALVELLVAERIAHPFWGARKLLAVLAASPADDQLAGSEYGRGSPSASPLGAPAAPTTDVGAPRRGPSRDDRPERSPDG